MPNLSEKRKDETLVALGKEIRRLRQERGYTQEALAFAAGVDRSYLGSVERGDNNVAFLTLNKLCKALQTTVAELAKEAGL